MLFVNGVQVPGKNGSPMKAPFAFGSRWGIIRAHAIASLYDNKKNELSIMKTEADENRMRSLMPYGYSTKVINGATWHYLVAISKRALEFLDYVDSVDIIKREDCTVEASAVFSNTELYIEYPVDDYKTLLVYSLNPHGCSEWVRCCGTLYDIICMTHDSCCADGFYLPVGAYGDEDWNDMGQKYYRVKCSNFEKAKALVEQARVTSSRMMYEVYRFGQ